MLIVELELIRLSDAPDGKSALDVRGTAVSCGICGVVVYPELAVLRNHTITVAQHSATWFSRDMAIAVHQCNADVANEFAIAEVLQLESVS